MDSQTAGLNYVPFAVICRWISTIVDQSMSNEHGQWNGRALLRPSPKPIADQTIDAKFVTVTGQSGSSSADHVPLV